jgi:hypothetical protein
MENRSKCLFEPRLRTFLFPILESDLETNPNTDANLLIWIRVRESRYIYPKKVLDPGHCLL